MLFDYLMRAVSSHFYRMIAIVLCFVGTGFPLQQASAEEVDEASSLKLLRIPYADDAIRADGILDEPCYQRHVPLRDFVVAGNPEQSISRTEYWLFWSANQLVFAARSEDATMFEAKPAATESKPDELTAFEGEKIVDALDRVELFLWDGKPNNRYHCFEFSYTGDMHDFKAIFREGLDSSWSPKAGYHYGTKRSEFGYTSEIVLPRAALEAMGIRLNKDEVFRIGLFRAEFDQFNGTPTWITWVDREGKKPHFHIEESFGVAKFVGQDE